MRHRESAAKRRRRYAEWALACGGKVLARRCRLARSGRLRRRAVRHRSRARARGAGGRLDRAPEFFGQTRAGARCALGASMPIRVAVPGIAVRATATITFIAQKRGLHTGAAAEFLRRCRARHARHPAGSVFGAARPMRIFSTQRRSCDAWRGARRATRTKACSVTFSRSAAIAAWAERSAWLAKARYALVLGLSASRSGRARRRLE